MPAAIVRGVWYNATIPDREGPVQRSFRYEEIGRELKEQIARGDFAAGQRLPSERELMRRYAVHRNTARQALAVLEAEGWISVEPKRGESPVRFLNRRVK